MDPAPGLCGSCAHAQPVRTRRSTFWRCCRADAEPQRFRRYPALPVLRCEGHEAVPGGGGTADGVSPASPDRD